MAIKMRVPAAYRDAFRLVAALSDESFGRTLDALSDRPATLSTSRLVDNIVAAVPELEPQADNLVLGLIGLGAHAQSHDVAPEEVGRQVTSSPELAIPEEQRAGFAERLVRLLTVEAITFTSKASDVLGGQKNLYQGSRIMSDVRPIFGKEARDLVGSLIIHTLELDYYDGTHHASFYVGLNTGELKQLGEAVERAQEKAETLRNLLQSAEVPYVDVEKE